MNEYESAFDFVKGRLEHLDENVSGHRNEYKQMDALEVLVRKSVAVELIHNYGGDDYYKSSQCFECEEYVDRYAGFEYCPNCGQKLKEEE